MPHTQHKIFHDFFSNKEINAMYITMALNSFAESLIALFIPIYLWQLNYSVIQILLFYFLWAFYWIIVSPLAIKLINVKGVKHSIFYSSFFMILFYLGLNFLNQIPWLFYILPLFAGSRTCLFWLGWHVNFIEHADSKKEGKSIALIQIIALIMNFITPFLGGLLIFLINWQAVFIIGSAVLLSSVFPLLKHKDTRKRISFDAKRIFRWILAKKHRRMTLSFFGYGAEISIGRILWPIFIFLILGNVEKVGGVVSLSLIASLIAVYIVGRLTDKMSKRRIIRIGTFLYALGWIGRIFADSAGFIFGIDTYKNVAGKIVEIPWGARTYDLTKKENVFEFTVAKEIAFRLVRLAVLPLLMILFWQLAAFGLAPFIICFIIAAILSIAYVIL